MLCTYNIIYKHGPTFYPLLGMYCGTQGCPFVNPGPRQNSTLTVEVPCKWLADSLAQSLNRVRPTSTPKINTEVHLPKS